MVLLLAREAAQFRAGHQQVRSAPDAPLGLRHLPDDPSPRRRPGWADRRPGSPSPRVFLRQRLLTQASPHRRRLRPTIRFDALPRLYRRRLPTPSGGLQVPIHLQEQRALLYSAAMARFDGDGRDTALGPGRPALPRPLPRADGPAALRGRPGLDGGLTFFTASAVKFVDAPDTSDCPSATSSRTSSGARPRTSSGWPPSCSPR